MVARVLLSIEREGPKTSRDFEKAGGQAAVEGSYRARHEAGLALYYLWLRGDTMIRERRRGEKVYDLSERLAPKKLLAPVSKQEAEDHLVGVGLRSFGLASLTEMGQILRGALGRLVSRQEGEGWLTRLEKEGKAVSVRVDGWPGEYLVALDVAEELDEVAAGNIPAAWKPLRDSPDEATLLAPLDRVVTAGRARRLFGFEYIWEVYTPAPKRRWGYYVLPVLFHDDLITRIEVKREKSLGLVVVGFWFEDRKDAANLQFARALGRGLARLGEMNKTDRIEVRARMPMSFRQTMLRASR